MIAAAVGLAAPALAAPETVTLNGAPIAVEVCGDETSPALVLLHDGLANSALWDGVWPLLCTSFHAVRYDRRGYGRSPPAKKYHRPIDDLAEVMKHAGIAHAHLVGAFTGAGIALEFLLEYPEAVDKLVLATPSVTGLKPPPEMIARLQKLEEPIRAGDMDAIVAAFSADPHLLGPDSTAAREKLAAILRASPGDLGDHSRQQREMNTRARLSEIYAPTLIVVGALDDPFNHAVAGMLREQMRAASLQVILETGHLLYLEQPGTFAGIVTEFLK